jgi:hypothetical protein
LFAIVMIATLALAASVLAAPSFTFDDDDDGPNDEPGQKDLTAQSSAFDGSDFYTAWLWDDLSWSGNNTGDGCSLFDTGGSVGNVNYAVCATIGGATPSLLSVTVYSCSDKRPDRCTNPVLLNTSTSYCTITNGVTEVFNSADTQATCNISDIADALSIPALNSATLLNTCSYPSKEPNSDPSDCVKTITNLNTTVGTLSSGTTTWTATLNDTATMSPITATGKVVFKLWSTNTCTDIGGPVWESGQVDLVNGTASTVGAATATGDRTITNLTVDGDGIYYWTVDYIPTGAFNSSSHACGETTTITPASVGGNSN